jgi:glycosyltransferase involved in cell wall biosynthesis
MLPKAAALGVHIIHNNEFCGVKASTQINMHIPHIVTTAHWHVGSGVIKEAFNAANEHNVISISESQRFGNLDLNYAGTVYNGVPVDSFTYVEEKGDELLWIGRMCPTKGPDTAIKVAAKLGRPLILAGKIDAFRMEYFRTVVEPLLTEHKGLVEFIGEINQAQADAWYGRAYALLMPIDWEEPFGLTAVEAMACGTPVIATRMGAMPEIIEHGVSGLLVDGDESPEIVVDRFIKAVEACETIRPTACLERAKRFSTQRMVDGYIDVYHSLLENSAP